MGRNSGLFCNRQPGAYYLSIINIGGSLVLTADGFILRFDYVQKR
jgi:hypothetical protein